MVTELNSTRQQILPSFLVQKGIRQALVCQSGPPSLPAGSLAPEE